MRHATLLTPPESLASLRHLLSLDKGSGEFEEALAKVLLDFSSHSFEKGHAEGLKEGLARGRRAGRGLPEIAKRPGRPKSVARMIKEAGGWPAAK
jgi:hypothetical protein